MADKRTEPTSVWDVANPSGGATFPVPAAVAPDVPGGGASARALGPGGIPVGRPLGLPPGAVVMGGRAGAASGGPITPAQFVRCLALLRPVRGEVSCSVLLGLVVSALPFVAGAANGPLLNAISQPGAGGGGVSGVWGSSGAMFSRDPGTSSGVLGWLATPLPFTVLLVIWTVALVLTQVLDFLNTWIELQVGRKVLAELRRLVHDHLQSLSLDFFTGARSGTLMQRVQLETVGVQRLLTECTIPPIADVVVLVVALAYLLALSWQMTFVSLTLAPLAWLTIRFVGRKIQGATEQQMMDARRLGGELEETISGISEIQVFNAQGRRNERFHEASDAYARSAARMMTWMQASLKNTQVFIALSSVVVVVIGVAFGARFGVNFPTLVVFIGFVPNMFAAAQRIITAYITYRSVVPNVVATLSLLDTQPSVKEKPDAATIAKVHGNIVFENVVFGYGEKQPILDGLRLSIREGETLALVGPIGSGKSTIFNLLLRFIDPRSGRIELDGRDISGVTLHSLRSQVSRLAQFPYFLKDTIRENIRLADQDASDGDIEAACRNAHVHSVITDPAKMPQGYETVVDVQVPSGGQKRLIALARCLLRKPEVLLLDEPTENLDADQRVRLTRVIREYAHSRTCVVVSHDMDFIAAVADRIVVLSGGRVIQEGTHQALLAAGGLYSQLYEAQNAEPRRAMGPE